MIHKIENSLNSEILELLTNQGLDGISEMARILMNAAMQLEREKYLNAASHERTEERKGYANGFKPKTINTRMGQIEFAIPQTRDSQFYPNSLEKGLRSAACFKTVFS